MKFLVWLCGVCVVLAALELSLFAHDGWRWVWFPVLVLWFFAGVTLAGVSLAKLAAGKVGAGVLSRPSRGPAVPPAPHKEE